MLILNVKKKDQSKIIDHRLVTLSIYLNTLRFP